MDCQGPPSQDHRWRSPRTRRARPLAPSRHHAVPRVRIPERISAISARHESSLPREANAQRSIGEKPPPFYSNVAEGCRFRHHDTRAIDLGVNKSSYRRAAAITIGVKLTFTTQVRLELSCGWPRKQ